MNYYAAIDEQFFTWIHAKGYTAQTRYKDEPVRGFTLWSSDNQKKVEIGVSRVDGDEVELAIYAGKKSQEKIAGKIFEISQLLDASENLARRLLM